ncbi:Hsp70 family protein [Pendulispora albinea]
MAGARLDEESARPEVLPISQLVAAGTVDARTLLPSFLYFAAEAEGAQALPWDAERRFAVGELARSRGADAPLRTISSAKSWLCHPGVDRRGGILPQGAPEDIEKISPVEVSWRYLEHLTEAWDARLASLGEAPAPLGQQEIVLTVPASFDAGARELTAEAAMAAGLEKVTLLEEPQAALYAWIEAMGERWRKELKVGDVILVVDVGGGTTDFSAIAAVETEGSLELVRVAVGDHILLGGDNMDLALAHVVKQKVAQGGVELDRWQMGALTHACRGAKERLLGDAKLDAVPIVLAARGSKLIGGGVRSELTRDEVTRVLVEGFFPVVPGSARPAVRARGALTQLGLPYASDAAVTKHLAAFLGRQADALARLSLPHAGTGTAADRGPSLLHPTAVLFNGGVMKSDALRTRLLGTLNAWLAEDGAPPVRTLNEVDYDLAVARGAAAYGLVRRGRGLRIRGGTARAYYVGIESSMPAVPGIEPPITALCVAPFGMEEGTQASLPPNEVGVVVGEPVRFRFFGSTVRREDEAGTELERWKEGELEELAPIEVTLPAEGRREGDVVPVRLHAAVSEVGTLLLEAVATAPRKPDERWAIELAVRGNDGST